MSEELPRKIHADQIEILSSDGSAPFKAGMKRSVVWVSNGGPVAWVAGLALLPLFLFIAFMGLSFFIVFRFLTFLRRL